MSGEQDPVRGRARGQHSGRGQGARFVEPPGAWPGWVFDRAPLNVYWEVTRACHLACRHCRAEAEPRPAPGQLDAVSGERLLQQIATLGSMLVLTGGDPLLRGDLMRLIARARSLRIPVAVTPSTTPSLTPERVEALARAGVAMLGLSLDGPDAAAHDAFRGVEGTFGYVERALRAACEVGLPVQVNTTVTEETLPALRELYERLCRQWVPPVKRWMLFVLVPTGRGRLLRPPSPEALEALLHWVVEQQPRAPFTIAVVEAPQLRRVWIERRLAQGDGEATVRQQVRRRRFGVRDGNGVVFVAYDGTVHPAGFLPVPVGRVPAQDLASLYRSAPLFAALRDPDRFRGPCGGCPFRWVCGGSRARALAMTGDALGSDPLCVRASAGAETNR